VGTRSYLLRKVAGALATLTFVLAFNFVLFRAIGDPVRLLTRSSTHLDEAEQQRLKEEFGLDKGLAQQFLSYVPDTLTGNLGTWFI
jgi:peptide/nickel transport system permease protein